MAEGVDIEKWCIINGNLFIHLDKYIQDNLETLCTEETTHNDYTRNYKL